MRSRILHPLALAVILCLAATSCGGGEAGRSSMGRQASQVAKEGRGATRQRYYTLGPKFEGQLDQMVGQEIFALTGRKEDLPLELNQEVLVNLNYFLNDGRGFMTRSLSRGQKYIPMMKAILKQKGLPEDLVYLALIESGYRTEAVSTASAVGPWQFISSTGRRYGLVINQWIDERMDPVKSTYAAADYLTTLHDMFNSWPLAIAAYNSGEGKIQKGMRNPAVDNFWDMAKSGYLAAETKRYVPSFLAAAIIAKDPASYGIEVDDSPTEGWEDVIVPEPVDLDLAAQLAGSSLDRLKELNPHLKKLTIPPGEPNFVLRVPQGSAPGFYKSYAALPAARRGSSLIIYTARRGDTVEKVAANHDLTAEVVRRYNSLEGSRLARGQELVLPPSMPPATVTAQMTPQMTSGAAAPAAVPAPAPSSGRQARGRAAATPPPASPAPEIIEAAARAAAAQERASAPTPVVASAPRTARQPTSRPVINTISHRVRGGDTISGLAKLYGVEATQIREDNKLASNDIREGQVLSIRSNLQLTQPAAERRSRDTWVEVTEGVPVYHTVKKGETVGIIAANYKLTRGRLRALNSLPSDDIKAGQRLVVGIGQEPSDGGEAQIYVVKSGDTIGGIAERHKMKSAELRRLNDLSSDKLQIGQKLRLAAAPAAKPAARAQSPPPAGVDVYTVVGGDTIGAIAERFGMRSAELRELNDLSSDFLRIGQELKVAAPSESAASAPAASDPGSAPAPKTPLLPGVETYEVVEGDTIGGIALRFGMSSAALRELNGFENDRIRLGQRIIVRPETRKPESPAPEAPLASGLYEVKSGDTLGGIAGRHNLRIAELRELNNLTGDALKIGQRLVVVKSEARAQAPKSPAPAPKSQDSAPKSRDTAPEPQEPASQPPASQPPARSIAPAATSVTAPSTTPTMITVVGPGQGSPASAQSPPPAARASGSGGGVPYVVKSGDTLGGIANRLGLRSRDLRELNGMESDKIRVGQTIMVPADRSGTPAASAPAQASARPAPAASASAGAPVAAGDLYVVKSGDTVSVIAERYGLRSAQLRELNGLENDNIRIGQKLKVPVGGPRPAAPKPSASSGGDLYEVKSGDTVSVIAERFGLKSAELRALNNLESDNIRIGQKLKVKR